MAVSVQTEVHQQAMYMTSYVQKQELHSLFQEWIRNSKCVHLPFWAGMHYAKISGQSRWWKKRGTAERHASSQKSRTWNLGSSTIGEAFLPLDMRTGIAVIRYVLAPRIHTPVRSWYYYSTKCVMDPAGFRWKKIAMVLVPAQKFPLVVFVGPTAYCPPAWPAAVGDVAIWLHIGKEVMEKCIYQLENQMMWRTRRSILGGFWLTLLPLSIVTLFQTIPSDNSRLE